MLKAEAELKAQIEALLDEARAADEAEKNEPELDILAEIALRQDRLDAIVAARARLEQRQRDGDLERGRSDDDDQKPRGQDCKPKGGRYKRLFGVPQDKDQDNFTDPRQPHHAARWRRVRPGLQRADRSRRHGPHHRGCRVGEL